MVEAYPKVWVVWVSVRWGPPPQEPSVEDRDILAIFDSEEQATGRANALQAAHDQEAAKYEAWVKAKQDYVTQGYSDWSEVPYPVRVERVEAWLREHLGPHPSYQGHLSYSVESFDLVTSGRGHG